MIGLLPLLNALFRPGRRGAAHTPSPGTDASGYYAYTALRDPDPSSSRSRSSRSTFRRAVPAALSKMSSSSKILRMVKKWQRSSGTKAAAAAADRAYSSLHHHGDGDRDGGDGGRDDDGGGKLPARGGDDDEAGGADVDGVVPDGCVEIYVGREKRRYVIDAAFLEREVIKRLIEKSNQKQEGFGGGGGGGGTAGLSIACEVVLFEHLLWLLKNGSWYDHETDDLADFYAC